MFPPRHPQNVRRMGRPGRRGTLPIPPIQQRPIVNQPIGKPLVPPRENQQNNLLSLFQTEDGNWDMEKISATASQMKGIYDQISRISPMVLRLFGR